MIILMISGWKKFIRMQRRWSKQAEPSQTYVRGKRKNAAASMIYKSLMRQRFFYFVTFLEMIFFIFAVKDTG